MKKTLYVKTIIAVAALVLLIYFCFHPLIYQMDYCSSVGIGTSHLYDSVVQRKGKPLSVQQDDDKDWFVCYDGLKINYGKRLEGAFECVIVTGKQYRFGIWGIGVGTSRKKIESVYKHIFKMRDVSKDEFGIIDWGDTWVLFKFDKNNNVSRIYISDGP